MSGLIRAGAGVSLRGKGAAGNGAGDDQAAIIRALASVPDTGQIETDGLQYRTTNYANILGKQFTGGGLIVKPDSHGGVVAMNTYVDAGKHIIGRENMYRFHKRLEVGGTLTGLIKGDSTAATLANGGGYAGPEFEPQILIADYLTRVKGVRNNISLTNYAVGGTRVNQMNNFVGVDQVNGSTDFVIISYGINDAQDGVQGFALNLDVKLTELRGNPYCRPDNLTVILKGPNATYDPGHGRSSAWYEQIRGVYEAAARKHNCVFYDTYARFKSVEWTATHMMDNPFSDGQTVHPLRIFQNMIWGDLIDSLLGESEMLVYSKDDWRPLIQMGAWTNYDNGWAPASASMSRDGWVSLRGLIKGGTVGTGAAVAQLPTGFFPYVTEMFEVAKDGGRCSMRVAIDGRIEQQDNSASQIYTSLSGIRFKAKG